MEFFEGQRRTQLVRNKLFFMVIEWLSMTFVTFLYEKKHLSYFLKGYHLVETKKFLKNSGPKV